jgi:hypothetical protein
MKRGLLRLIITSRGVKNFAEGCAVASQGLFFFQSRRANAALPGG